MRLQGDDLVTGFDVVRAGADLLVLHELGLGKRVQLEEFNTKGRYTQGVWTTDHSRLAEVGPIVAARVVDEKDQITVITGNGIMLRTPVAGISRIGRLTRGVRIVNLDKGDTVAALAVLRREDLMRKTDGTDVSEGGGSVAVAVDPVPVAADD